MKKIKKNMNLASLDSWGTAEDLGSEILEGDAKVYGKVTFGTPEDKVHAAYFGVTKSKFRMTYPFTEQATVVSGSVTFTNEDTGETAIYSQGESWLVEKGTRVLWEIHSDEFIKHYLAAV